MTLPTCAAIMAMGAIAWAGGPTTSPRAVAPAKKPATVTTVRKTAARPAAATTAAKKPATGTASRKAPVARTTWRNRQAAPTADRYREIQDALVARGYLSAEDANGTWGAASADALKRFQAEQTLESTGKIDSLSLIALGLGPRHDSASPRIVDGNAQPEYGRNNNN